MATASQSLASFGDSTKAGEVRILPAPRSYRGVMKLNPQQEEVANHIHGRILTLAGPGSGKTRTLTERTGRLIRAGYNPGSILCLTFTNKARDEMRDRITAAFGEATKRVFISNFHGLCGMILRRLGGALGCHERPEVIGL